MPLAQVHVAATSHPGEVERLLITDANLSGLPSAATSQPTAAIARTLASRALPSAVRNIAERPWSTFGVGRVGLPLSTEDFTARIATGVRESIDRHQDRLSNRHIECHRGHRNKIHNRRAAWGQPR